MPLIVSVTCGGCGRPMKPVKVLARVVWKTVADTIHMRWACETPDCGTEVDLEDDIS